MSLYQIDLGVVLLFILVADVWIVSMLRNFVRALTAIFKEEDWRIPMYEFCGQVIITIACMIGGFWIMTR